VYLEAILERTLRIASRMGPVESSSRDVAFCAREELAAFR